MANAALTFALYRNETLVRRLTVEEDVVKIGMDGGSHLRLEDPHVSRMHAIIEVQGPRSLVLIDLGNQAGTRVNGARVDKCALHVGDHIEVGSSRIVLEQAESLARGTVSHATAPFGDAGSAESASSNPFATAVALSPLGRGENPFAPPSASTENQDPDAYTYTLLPSGPAVPSEEVELAHADAIEVTVLWGTNVLHVSHLSPPKSFYVGEPREGESCDFLLPEEKLGVARMPLVVGDESSAAVVLPPGATGFVEVAGQARKSLDRARAEARPCSAWSAAQELPLPLGATVTLELNGLVFRVAAVKAGKPAQRSLFAAVDRSAAAFFGLSLLSFGGLATAMAYFLPPLGLEDEGRMEAERLLLVQQYLSAAAEREQEKTEEATLTDSRTSEGSSGEQAAGESGSLGKPTSTATNRRFEIKGPPDNPDPHLARSRALQEAREFGVIGLLNADVAGDPNAPTAPWGRDTSSGMGDLSAQGNMWGDDIGEAFGSGGLSLVGLGEGGDRRGVGVGLDGIGTIGHGRGDLGVQGIGIGRGLSQGVHETKAPRVRTGPTTVSGRLPPEVIQRIVRQNFGRFRMCYEQGLARNPTLTGRVGIRFVIGRDGAVSNVSNGGSDIPDANVVSCVLSGFYGVSFPPPEGGIVTVTYPLMFTPG